MSRARLAVVVLVALAGEAAAHNRDPYAVDIHFKPDDPQHVIIGTTFGLLVSDDGGATYRWACEQALGYQDPFDPDYAYTTSGSVMLQTFGASRLATDACTFEPSALGERQVSRVEAAGDGALYAAMADTETSDSAIYKSTDGGATFPLAVTPAAADWWESIEVSPSDPQRIYVTGFRFETTRVDLLFRSDDGGASYTAMSASGLDVDDISSRIRIVGIGPAADTVYVQVTQDPASRGDAIYRSTDAGATWTRILTTTDPYGVAFLVRASGQLVAATRSQGAQKSDDGGMTWQPLPAAPHIASLAESPAGVVWAGTQTHKKPGVQGQPEVPADGYFLMTSTDLATWTGKSTFVDILEPMTCPAVHAECGVKNQGVGTAWCCLLYDDLQVPSRSLDCSGPNVCYGYQDAGVSGDMTTRPPDPGCCSVSSEDGGWTLVLSGLFASWQLLRRRVSARQRR
jgi:MYXO-CTERM domain-containing protein